MNGAQTQFIAGQVGFLITNGGIHTPETWAETTVGQLFETGPGITEKRANYAEAMRQRAKGLLVSAFHSVKSDSSDKEMYRTAFAVQAQIAGYADATPWEAEFNEEHIAAIMREVIFCNLRTAADLAVRME